MVNAIVIANWDGNQGNAVNGLAIQILPRFTDHAEEGEKEHMSLGVATAEVNNLSGAFTIADQRMYADKAARKSNQNHFSASGTSGGGCECVKRPEC